MYLINIKYVGRYSNTHKDEFHVCHNSKNVNDIDTYNLLEIIHRFRNIDVRPIGCFSLFIDMPFKNSFITDKYYTIIFEIYENNVTQNLL